MTVIPYELLNYFPAHFWIEQKSQSQEQMRRNQTYQVVTKLVSSGHVSLHHDEFLGPCQDRLTLTLSDHRAISKMAETWLKIVLPHDMAFLRITLFIHTGHSIVRTEHMERVVRIPVLGSIYHLLLLVVAAHSSAAVLSAAGE